ncbi:DUF6233 domain-containing protein [Streptomyces bobili]
METTKPATVREILGRIGPPAGSCQKLGGGRGPGQGVIHAVDCGEVPAGAPPLTLDQALDAAERPGVRLCSLCGAALELDPVLRSFDHVGN